MIDLLACRRVLTKNGLSMTDGQIEVIRQTLTQLAEIEYQQFKFNQQKTFTRNGNPSDHIYTSVNRGPEGERVFPSGPKGATA